MAEPSPEDVARVLALLDEPYVTPLESDPDEEARQRDAAIADGAVPDDATWVPYALPTPLSPPVQKPVEKRRTARIDPDDRRVLGVVLALVFVVSAAAGAASFAGQTAMGPYTGLPPWLFFVIPMFIDLPIMVVSFLIPIFRARGESVVTSWIMLGTLTALSSAVNIVHVLASNGGTLNINTLTGCVIMGLAPIVIMIAFEETVRLAVHTPEKE